MKRHLFLAFLLLSTVSTLAQQKYWLEAPLDKRGWIESPGCRGILMSSIDWDALPLPALSERAYQRRERQRIPIRQTDYSHRDPTFEAKLKDLGVEIHGYSRWFNSYSISLPAEDFNLEELKALYTDREVELIPVRTLGRLEAPQTSPVLDETPIPSAAAAPASHLYKYGQAWAQTEMVHGEALHDLGYDGSGMLIGVIDGAFFNADNIGPLYQVFQQGRVLATYDFVNGDTNVFRPVGSHGTRVWSIMAADLEPQFVGSAPRASYVLLRSEDDESESKVEEDNWIFAMEFADSMGVDVINSSLGYNVFDTDPSYFPSDMDGRTAIVTRGAVMAHRVGMVVMNSAGNSGASSWRIITAPADADSILSIGAVDSLGQVAAFSSRGPTADGRIKPDVSAQGVLTAHLGTSGTVTRGNGTSFSSPLLAGFVTCFWQANPNATNYEIMDWVRQSASHYARPNNDIGYGIPNFQFAMELSGTLSPNPSIFYPNPSAGALYVKMKSDEKATYQIIDINGRVVADGSLGFARNDRILFPLGAANGLYQVRVIQGDEVTVEKVLLQRP
ncbi:MAG: T9SS type A sorting domain-containing protein [Bacteroidetes bacterium]|nr:MAG: T9SS type A sorting domain-containing protein [Bacteroidota bacterium]